ncbi:Helix-turn-helix domain [Frankia canadensis]|uniref:Helix-turn-helix domain n=1 Tax=Frankia canadensis TaxID=1836972 RepID=A0A2I2KQ53_9ACTN|nr:helix-turn-helix domain-containing protein [Frankia canadensis]SNQ47792.1 Helix-turn-helix domain [Frankia canadensis]SOU55082.1 Helix-turn-helix domain [Frankia canadensis]
MVAVGVTPDGAAVAARRRELGACLRAYRALIEPASVGLPTGERRRVAGLRREELAALAGVSLTWYTGLEQGRVAASRQVLDAVGRVLGLDGAGRRHLSRLSAPEPPALTPPGEQLRDLESLVTSWPGGPAALLDHRLDVLATNASWEQLLGDPSEHEPARRHVLGLLAHAPGTTGLLRSVARQFRMAADLHAGDPRIAEISALLRADHPMLEPLWNCRGIGAFGRPHLDLAGEPAAAHLLHPTGQAETAILVVAPSGPVVR